MPEPVIDREDDAAILKIKCPGCGIGYRIKRTVIASFPATFKCKKCGHKIRIEAPVERLPSTDAALPKPPVMNSRSESVNAVVAPVPSPPPPLGAKTTESEGLAVFIGNNAAHYMQRFAKFTTGGAPGFVATWHWPAFLVPWLWFLYRKLYLWSLIAFITGFIPLVNLAGRIAWGLTANFIFYKHVQKKTNRIKEIVRHQPTIPLEQNLRRQGGVNSWVWGVSAAPVLGIIAAIAIPQFISYRTREYDVQAKAAIQQVIDAQQGYYMQNDQYSDSLEQLRSTGLNLQGGPDLQVSLLGAGVRNYCVEGFHVKGNKRFAACATYPAIAELPKKSKEIFGPEHTYMMTVPDGWRQVDDLNDVAELQIAHPSKDCYLIVIAENQADMQGAELEYYSQAARDGIRQQLLESGMRETGLDTINDHSVIQYEIQGIFADKNLPVVYLHTSVLGRNNYYQIIAWTTKSNCAANQSSIKSIVNHFKEI